MILLPLGYWGEGIISPYNGYTYCAAMVFVSQMLAMYFLLLLFMWIAPPMRKMDLLPWQKLLSIKCGVFLSFFQGLGIAIAVQLGIITYALSFQGPNLARDLQNALICMEMPIYSLAQFRYYHYTLHKKKEVPEDDVYDKLLDSNIDMEKQATKGSKALKKGYGTKLLQQVSQSHCVHCGFKWAVRGAKFCSECGEGATDPELEHPHCHACGSLYVRKDAKFCVDCGSPNIHVVRD